MYRSTRLAPASMYVLGMLCLVVLTFSKDSYAISKELVAGINAGTLAVIINDDDPLSIAIGKYYRSKRHIPDANVIHIRFLPGAPVMSRAVFQNIKASVDARVPKTVQAYALTWAAPYRVDCMSITTAFAVGFDKKYCAQDCRVTKVSPYFNSDSRAPFSDYRMRPTMALAGHNLEEVRRLIDRGIASDGTFPRGTGYLVSTSDRARNVRADIYADVARRFSQKLNFRIVHAESITDRKDVLFYFTGSANVPKLDTNRFVPGAIADHLTSTGGQLTDSTQMSSLDWLTAGATGSYGTVVEPCNFTDKFPTPGVLIKHYLAGESLIEAYWKSVVMPGQGIFIGEPLATPYVSKSAGNNATLR